MIGGSVKKYDSQIQPYIQNILDILPDLEDGHQREFLKVLNQLELVEEHEGQLLDFSISVWEQLKKQPSVRHTAFRIMVKAAVKLLGVNPTEAAKKYPELANEVLLLTQPQYINTLSPGVKKGVFKMLEELRKYKGENN